MLDLSGILLCVCVAHVLSAFDPGFLRVNCFWHSDCLISYQLVYVYAWPAALTRTLANCVSSLRIALLPSITLKVLVAVEEMKW